MDRLSDLIVDSELVTQLRNGYTREEYWRPVSEIGEGGYGSVELQECVQGERNIKTRAVKKISSRPLNNGKPIDVSRELEAIAKFSHEKYAHCFVKSYGWYQEEDNICIAMEYLHHGDLGRYMSSSPPLREDAAGDVTHQILEGLSYMHNHGFVHRDLKPQNILIQSCPPQPWWVKIGDFGISKRRIGDMAQSTLLQGTLGYIAPELYQLIPMGTMYAADMWSLGEVTFRLMTKQPVFKYMTLLITYTTRDHTFPVANLVTYNISSSAQDFISSLMAPTPEKRLTADAALKHHWIVPYLLSEPQSPSPPQLLPTPKSSPPPLTRTTSRMDSLTEELASWNTTIMSSPPQGNPTRTLYLVKGEHLQLSSSPHLKSAAAENTQAHSMLRMRDYYIGVREGHGADVYAVAFSPDGATIASGSKDSTIRIWDAVAGNEVRRIQVDGHPLYIVMFSPDGATLLSLSQNNVVRIWDTATGQDIRKLRDFTDFRAVITTIAFSLDGTTIALGLKDKTISIWHIATRGEIRRLIGHYDQVEAVAFSPDGATIVSGSWDRTIRLWDTNTGREIRKLEGHRHSVNAIAFSPDGTTLVSGSNDGTVRTWDIAT